MTSPHEPAPPPETGQPAPGAPRNETANREKRILRMLAAGVNPAEIADRVGLSPEETRDVLRSLFARRRDALPEHFLETQALRLEEAMIVAYSAMGGGNIKAVNAYVRIVGQLGRLHGEMAEERRRIQDRARGGKSTRKPLKMLNPRRQNPMPAPPLRAPSLPALPFTPSWPGLSRPSTVEGVKRFDVRRL